MKIAALYDIHGNLPALNALLEELKEVQPDLIVVGGDIVSGPMPEQTLTRLLQPGNQLRFLRGNNDREAITAFHGQPINRRYLPAISEKGYAEARWVAEQLTPSQRDLLATLPERLVFQVENLGSILFCHATPQNDEEIFTSITPEEHIHAIFSDVEQEIVVCGHTHMQFELHTGKTRVLNAGSVGMPFADQPGAYWLLLSPEGYEFRYTPYDIEAAAQEISASGSSFAQAFIAENVLHVATAEKMTQALEDMRHS